MARILLGVTGGIAAYKALELVRLAMKAGHAVRVIQTRAAQEFVGAASFAGITGAPVLRTEWEPDPLRGAFPGDPMPAHAPLSHLALVDRADVYVIAPATAHTLARLAAGLADDLLTAAALACRRPMVLAPAMNDAMWEHPATQANVATLRARGARVLEPGVGALGSIGEWGAGRLPEPPELLAALEAALAARPIAGGPGPIESREASGRAVTARRAVGDLDGLRVLVTAGGTREPIDAVRFIGNRSSGRMGFALAQEAAARGARVTVIAANVALARASGIAYVDVGTAAELKAAALEHFEHTDLLLMAAAVADFRPARAHDGKIKKPVDDPTSGLRIDLERTDDVLGALAARRRPGQVLVGFAAEHGAGAVEYGRGKLERKKLDLVVVNDVSDPRIGFDARENEVVILGREVDPIHVPRKSKADVARAILDAALSCSSSSLERVP